MDRRRNCFCSGSRKACRIAVWRKPPISSAVKEKACWSRLCSRNMSVPETVMLSVLMVQGMPSSRKCRTGYSAREGQAPVWRLLVGHSSSQICCSASRLITCGSSTLRRPCPIRTAPKLTAEATLSGPPASPAWVVRGRPRTAALANRPEKALVG